MKIYLDNCCYNRPYDDQSQLRVSLETQAKLHIQELIRLKRFDLVTSYILIYEISQNPHISNSRSIMKYIDTYSTVFVSADNELKAISLAGDIQETGIKKMDALHVACAMIADADYFLTTDKRLLKFQCDSIRIMNPIEFLNEMEE